MYSLTLILIKDLLLILPLVLTVAFFTLLERKILSLIGSRMGPYKVSLVGILQPFSDAFKLMGKSSNFLVDYSAVIYYSSAIIGLMGSLTCWFFLSFNPDPYTLKFGLIFILLVLGLNSFVSMLMGWSTFTKFSILGSMRSVSQLISYEPCLYLVIFFPLVVYSTTNLSMVSLWELSFFILVPFILYVWIPCILAELNRSPFDFSEGESELVSGFNTEFGSLSFTLIFLMEYAMMLFMSFLTSLILVKNFLFSFIIMTFFIVWSRASLPRFRFDKLMAFSWKILVPLCTSLFILFMVWLI